MERLNPAHVEWARNHFRVIADGGTWGLPSIGLIFNKRGNTLVLTARMPHMAEMPITAEQLRAEQDTVFEQTKLHFGAAGIAVIDETGESR